MDLQGKCADRGAVTVEGIPMFDVHTGGDDWAAIGWANVESQEALDKAMQEHGAAIMGDVPNYTNVQPELLVGEITGGSQ